jgi:prepilin-type N-terminal cleavage/methylation domain-containing protein
MREPFGTSKGFSLLEILIGMFILSLMMTVVLKHQIFLLEMQRAFEGKQQKELDAHHQALVSGAKI